MQRLLLLLLLLTLMLDEGQHVGVQAQLLHESEMLLAVLHIVGVQLLLLLLLLMLLKRLCLLLLLMLCLLRLLLLLSVLAVLMLSSRSRSVLRMQLMMVLLVLSKLRTLAGQRQPVAVASMNRLVTHHRGLQSQWCSITSGGSQDAALDAAAQRSSREQRREHDLAACRGGEGVGVHRPAAAAARLGAHRMRVGAEDGRGGSVISESAWKQRHRASTSRPPAATSASDSTCCRCLLCLLPFSPLLLPSPLLSSSLLLPLPQSPSSPDMVSSIGHSSSSGLC